tara:strand:+ start:1313 stop:1867 length:555 start_codon:yes stop_codon:yes gene_type:complete
MSKLNKKVAEINRATDNVESKLFYVNVDDINKLKELDSYPDVLTGGIKAGLTSEWLCRSLLLSIVNQKNKTLEAIENRDNEVNKINNRLLSTDESISLSVSNKEFKFCEDTPAYKDKMNIKINILDSVFSFIEQEVIKPIRGTIVTDEMIEKDNEEISKFSGNSSDNVKEKKDAYIKRLKASRK